MNNNIFFLSSNLSCGGSELLWIKTAIYAKKQGYNITCMVYKNNLRHPWIKKLISNNVKVICWNAFIKTRGSIIKRIYFYVIRRLHAYYNFFRILFYNPKTIFVNQGNAFEFYFYMPVYYSLLKRYHGNNKISIEHSLNKVNPTAKEKRKIIDFYKSIFLSCFVAEATKQKIEKMLESKIANYRIVRNPVSFNDYSILNYPKDNISIFAIVGQLHANKGQHKIIKILSGPRWRERKWHLKIAGNGQDLKHLEKMVNDLELVGRVEFCGFIKEIKPFWHDVHLNILPSTVESAPISIVEAMICGRPTVATDVGGVTDWIDNETGFIAKSYSLNDIEVALENAWQNKDKWEDMGKKAHEKAIKQMGHPEKDLLNLLLAR